MANGTRDPATNVKRLFLNNALRSFYDPLLLLLSV